MPFFSDQEVKVALYIVIAIITHFSRFYVNLISHTENAKTMAPVKLIYFFLKPFTTSKNLLLPGCEKNNKPICFRKSFVKSRQMTAEADILPLPCVLFLKEKNP